MPNNNKYYPALSEIVNLNDFPEFLQFIENGIEEILNNLFYKNLYISKSINGDAAFYSLSILSPKKIALELPGTGIFLVLNPDYQDFTISSFPISISWEWKILAFINSFNTDNFSFSVTDFYNLGIDVLGISKTNILKETIKRFVIPSATTSRKAQLVMDVNNFYNTSIPIPSGNDQLETLVTNIEQQTGVSIYESILTIYLASGTPEEQQEKLNIIFSVFAPDDIQTYIKELIFPKVRATLAISAGLEFPRNILKPVYDISGNNPYDTDAAGGTPFDVIPQDGTTGYPKVVLRFAEALFYVDTEQGLGYNMDIALSTNVPAQIGNTGLIIDIQNLKIDLSSTQNFVEADKQGLSPEFMGVYTDYTAIVLPKKWFNNVDNTTLQVVGRNLLMGTGGVSGTISLETLSGDSNNGNTYLGTRIGDWAVGFNYFDVRLRQNVIEDARIEGLLTIPGLKEGGADAKLLMIGDIESNGNFNLTFSDPGGIAFTLFDFVTFNITSAELGRQGEDFYIGTSCEIWFQNQTMNKLLDGQKIVIPKLRIYDNGRMEIVGGTTSIPANISLNLGPVEVAVTGIHFGSHQEDGRNYNYWGFDGAISLDPLGIDARGEGIKYYYTVDDDEHGGIGDSFLRIQTIEVDMVIPGSASPESAMAIIHGMLSLPEPGESPEYYGEIDVKLPKAKIAAGAAMRLQPRHPAFIVDAYVDLPAPIPLGPVGIYGFRGLLGYRYVAEKEAVGLTSGEDTWYDYYIYPPKGIDIQKFSGPEETVDYQTPVALGAGALLGTSFDGGSLLSVRAMLLLSLPSVFMIDGRASILSKRLGLTDGSEPPFFAGMAWGDDSLEMWIGADYSLPQSGNKGWILDIYAEVQAGFFFNNPSQWYVNFGTKEKPITAEALTIFTTQSYLMLSASGITTGSRAEFNLQKRFGPAKVK